MDIPNTEEEIKELDIQKLKECFSEITDSLREILTGIHNDIEYINDKFRLIAPKGLIPFKIILDP